MSDAEKPEESFMNPQAFAAEGDNLAKHGKFKNAIVSYTKVSSSIK
jgi:hypothetical protein